MLKLLLALWELRLLLLLLLAALAVPAQLQARVVELLEQKAVLRWAMTYALISL